MNREDKEEIRNKWKRNERRRRGVEPKRMETKRQGGEKKRYEQKIDAVAAMMDAYIAYKANKDAFE